MHEDSLKTTDQREASLKIRKGDQSFLYSSHCLNLIYIAIKFQKDIPYGHLLMVLKSQSKISSKGSS